MTGCNQKRIDKKTTIVVRRENFIWCGFFLAIGIITGIIYIANFYKLNRQYIFWETLALLFLIAGVVALLLGRKKIVTITNELVYFFPGILCKPIQIKIEDIGIVKICSKKKTEILGRYGVAVEAEYEVLFFSLKRRLDEDSLLIANKIDRSFLSQYSQVEADEEGKALWIKNNSTRKYKDILSKLSNFVEI